MGNNGLITNSQICLPTQQTQDCNPQLGGIKIFTATDGEVMNWSCACLYPEYAVYDENTKGCKLLPNVCGENGKFDWDATRNLPTDATCTCNTGYTPIYDYQGRPLCVDETRPMGFYPCYGTDKNSGLGMFCN